MDDLDVGRRELLRVWFQLGPDIGEGPTANVEIDARDEWSVEVFVTSLRVVELL